MVDGYMTKSKARAHNIKQMETDMKDIGNITKNKDEGYYIQQVGIDMKENGKIIKCKAMANNIG